MAVLLIVLLLIHSSIAFEVCEFTCPFGHVKRPTGSPVEANGCGVQGLIIKQDRFPGFNSRRSAINTIAAMESVGSLKKNAILNSMRV